MSREPAPGAPAECSTTHSRDCTEERAPKLGQTALALAAGNCQGAGQSLIPKVSLIAARLCSCRSGNKLPVPHRQRAARLALPDLVLAHDANVLVRGVVLQSHVVVTQLGVAVSKLKVGETLSDDVAAVLGLSD